jgi:hypothetical protein
MGVSGCVAMLALRSTPLKTDLSSDGQLLQQNVSSVVSSSSLNMSFIKEETKALPAIR